ncbi:orotidine 5'-phosphate decarboxylase [Rickettsiales bacterium]|nr:orotidine 5'-phosphate decarboxylase [Rickettsiales bacterium]
MHNPIICAIDTENLDFACKLVKQLKDCVGAVKLGLEFFVANGAPGVQKIADIGTPIFLDLKFHDIPNTVSAAVRAACKLDIFMLTVHIAGGEAMLQSALEAAEGRVKIIGVTVLTHIGNVQGEVLNLAKAAHMLGLDGVVCAADEALHIKEVIAKENFLVITPGIRPEGSPRNEQKRVATPQQAVAMGTDYIVLGRPITTSKDPKGTVMQILDSIGLQ